jgi:puromycin-sensitive aminopeptidase
MGWEPAEGEDDSSRLRRAAALRAVGVVAREPGASAEGRERLGRFLRGERGALEPNLHEVAVTIAARSGDGELFDELEARFKAEPDPAFQRRYLVGLALFEDPAQAARAREMALSNEVPLQDTASFMGALLSNRTARDDFWRALRERWAEVQERVGGAPMLLRRVIEAVGQLPERRHLEQAREFFAAHPLRAAKQAIAQTLERMRQDVELWERAERGVGAWLSRSSDYGATSMIPPGRRAAVTSARRSGRSWAPPDVRRWRRAGEPRRGPRLCDRPPGPRGACRAGCER